MSTTARTGHLTGRLLVVDLDFFFPNPAYTATLPHAGAHLYDWGHLETPLHRELIWPARAAAFAASGKALPRCHGLDQFWRRFRLHTDTLLVADSNAFAGDLTPPGGTGFAEVLLFDAHHDSGYRRTLDDFATDGRYTCEDWTFLHYARGSRISVRYPRWLPDWPQHDPPPHIPVQRATDDGRPVPGGFNVAFCCRSGSWVPPWCDDQWSQLLAAFPGRVEVLDPALRQPRWNEQRQSDYQRLLTTTTQTLQHQRESRHPLEER